jgi:hypothetical protein
MAKGPCFGFTDTALGQYRGVDDKPAFEQACADLCKALSRRVVVALG